MYGLRPSYEPLGADCQAGGIGGSATPIGMADMPVGIASAHGLCRFVMLEDPSDKAKTPALVPIKFLIQLASVIEPRTELLSSRTSGAKIEMVTLPSGHQTVSLVCFGQGG